MKKSWDGPETLGTKETLAYLAELGFGAINPDKTPGPIQFGGNALLYVVEDRLKGYPFHESWLAVPSLAIVKDIETITYAGNGAKPFSTSGIADYYALTREPLTGVEHVVKNGVARFPVQIGTVKPDGKFMVDESATLLDGAIAQYF